MFEAFDLIQHGVKKLPGKDYELCSKILEREGVAKPNKRSATKKAVTTSSDTPRPQSQKGRRDRMEDRYPGNFWELKITRVTRYYATPFLLNGSKESLIDTLVANAMLWGKLDFAKAAKSKLYFTITCNISELAKRIHRRSSVVKASLKRLEKQYRIHVPQTPTRGRNSMTIHIGVKSGVLFAPVLTPQVLWNMSMRRYLRAAEQADLDTMAKELGRLTRHYQRLPEGNGKTRSGEILDGLHKRAEAA